ncbi:MAG: fatty acid desaturase family protein [Propionibacteriaceae bacterium]
MTITAPPPRSPLGPASGSGTGRTRPSSGFKPLVGRVKAAGLLEPRIDWYVGHALVLTAGLVVLAAAVILVAPSWWVVAVAVFAAFMSAQLSFLGHDAGHHQITSNRKVSHVIGLVLGNVLTGLSFGWWQDKHLRHHANPNHEGLDPDVGEGIISWSEKQYEKKSGAARWFSARQAWFFFPLLTLEGFHLKIAGLRSLRERPKGAQRLEAGLLIGHYVAYCGILFFLLSPLQAVAFILVHQALYGLQLGCAFAPNHKGMEMPAAGSRMDHLHKQVLTSRDVRGGFWVDLMLGGLNYQIEHHLFPSIPRPNLRRAQPVIADYCTEIGLPFRICGVVESYAECLAHLDSVSAADDLRQPVARPVLPA